MPYKKEITSINLSAVNKDRRIKLTEEDKVYIKELYEVEHLPVREIERIFEGKCSRRLIQFVLFPERRETARKRFKEHWKEYRPTKEKWASIMREHRAYKKKVYQELQ